MQLKTTYISLLFFYLLFSAKTKAQISIASIGATYTENFDGIGSSATASLPSGWRLNSATTYSTGVTATTLAAGTSGAGALTSVSTGGYYNFADGITASSTDRAVGFLNSGSFTSPRSLFVQMDNNTGSTITFMNITFDIEKYRSGSRAFNINFFTSTDGITWTSAPAGDQAYAANANNNVISNPPVAINKSFALSGLSIATGTSFYLRWACTGVGGSTNGQGLGIDNFSVNCCATNSYFYETVTTGNWSNPATWEVSANGSTGWVGACSPPSSAAAGVTILNGHTVTIDVNSSSPDLTINAGGTLQANSTSFVSFTEMGNITNNGTLQLFNSPFGVDVSFNKNGNQSITGTGAVTNFYSIAVNLGSTTANVLNISPTNFSSSTNLMVNSSGVNTLLNGTIEFSGTYTFANRLFNTAGPTLPATTALWLNNPNVTITPYNYTYTVSGFIKITSGTFNVGTTSGNSIILKNNSLLIVQGGTVNVSGRIQAVNAGGTSQTGVTYNQSGGIVNLLTVGSGSATLSGFEMDLASDNFNMSGGLMVFQNEASAVELYNYATGTVTGGTIQFGDASSTNITSTGFFINSSCTLPSIVIDNSSGLNPIVKLYHDLSVFGSITINSGTTLNNSYDDGIHFVDIYDIYNITLSGNWNNSGTFANWNSHKVTFNGTSAQQITGTTSTTFNRLTIANSSGGVTLQTPESVDSVLSLLNGYVYTSAADLLTMNIYSSVGAVSNSSFVYGPVAKTGSTAFVFPVGKDLEYRPIADSALSASETFTAEYFHTSPTPTYDITLLDPTLDHVSNCEYWIFNRAGSANAFVKLSWDTYSCGVSVLSDLKVARWDGAMWRDHGNGGTTGTISTGTVITSALVTSFSPFTLASVTSSNPLPIELLNFTANYNGYNAVNINWSTASETNNDYFTVERSADAIDFTEINKTKGAGNSSQTISYITIDNKPLPGISYYRLKQTDFNGNYKYSGTVSVNIENTNDFEVVNTYTASSESGLEVTINCSSNCQLNIELYNMLGEKIFETTHNFVGSNSKVIIPVYTLNKGIYLLKVYNADKTISKKIIY